MLAVVGEPGIGKTALLDDAFTRATNMRHLRANGIQSEAQIPFASLFELVRPALGALERIPVPQATALEGALALRPPKREDRLAIGAATLSLLAAYAEETPLLVLVDDVQWIDASSASALLFAARRLGDDPVAILLAAREHEPSFLDGSDLPRLRLEGLDLEASRLLLLNGGDDDSQFGVGETAEVAHTEELSEVVVRRLHRETGGNPLALLELGGRSDPSWGDLTPLQEPLAAVTGVARSFAARFESLPQAAQRLLLLVAASDSSDLSLLTRAAPRFDTTMSGLRPAVLAGLVTTSEERIEWRHPLARSAVYGSVEARQRRAAHRALADTLPDRERDRRAWHLALAADGYDEAAASALEQAASRATARSAYAESSYGYATAASLTAEMPKRASLLYAAADMAALGGLSERAEELLTAAESDGGDALLWARIQHLRGQLASRRGDVTTARQFLREAATVACKLEPRLAVIMLAESIAVCFFAGLPDEMRSVAASIAELAAHLEDTQSRFFAMMSEGMALDFSGQGRKGGELIRGAVNLLEQSDELHDDLRLLSWAVFGPLWLREIAGGPLVERALSAARERGAAGILPFVLWPVALHRASTDRWDEAAALFHEAIDRARDSEQRAELTLALARLAGLEARTGQGPTCRQHANEALSLSSELGLVFGEVWALAALGDLALSEGRPDEAMPWYERQCEALRTRHISDPDMSPVPEMVESLLRLGKRSEAASLAGEFVTQAENKGLPWSLARAARTRGLLASHDDYERCFIAALELHEETPDLFEAARTRLAFASRLRRGRQRVRAREELHRAIDDFDRLGAEPWADAARAELAATGERARPRDPRHTWELTPQEMQIAVLLAERRTTREAAAALFLSPKTIEYHLRSIYRKLGISSRAELSEIVPARKHQSSSRF